MVLAAPTVCRLETVSYTHLDVYKRQVQRIPLIDGQPVAEHKDCLPVVCAGDVLAQYFLRAGRQILSLIHI